MLDTLLEHVLKEWKVIGGAPYAFTICIAFCAALIFFGLEWFHSEKEGAQAEQVNLLKARLDECRLAAKTVAEAAAKPLLENAEFKLHTYGDNRTPTLISSENIWRWYYLRNLFIGIDKKTGKKEQTGITNLFISFDNPVVIKTLEINSSDINLPKYEVKEFNNRFAIISFDGELPSGTLVVSVH